MNDRPLRLTAAFALVVGAALLTVRYFRRGNDLAAAGLLVFVAAETLIVSAWVQERHAE